MSKAVSTLYCVGINVNSDSPNILAGYATFKDADEACQMLRGRGLACEVTEVTHQVKPLNPNAYQHSEIYSDLDWATWYLTQVLADMGDNPDYYGSNIVPTREKSNIHRRVKRLMREIQKLAEVLPQGDHVRDFYENGIPA